MIIRKVAYFLIDAMHECGTIVNERELLMMVGKPGWEFVNLYDLQAIADRYTQDFDCLMMASELVY